MAYQARAEVDLSYVRCLKVLMAGQGYPMVATHDPRLVEIAGALAVRHGRAPGTFEFQMLLRRPPRRAAPARRRRARRSGSTCRTATSGTAT